MKSQEIFGDRPPECIDMHEQRNTIPKKNIPKKRGGGQMQENKVHLSLMYSTVLMEQNMRNCISFKQGIPELFTHNYNANLVVHFHHFVLATHFGISYSEGGGRGWAPVWPNRGLWQQQYLLTFWDSRVFWQWKFMAGVGLLVEHYLSESLWSTCPPPLCSYWQVHKYSCNHTHVQHKKLNKRWKQLIFYKCFNFTK